MPRAEGGSPRWLPWVLALVCLGPRLPGLTSPLLEEGHAWRQSVTAMIARNYARHGYCLFWPEIDTPPHEGPLDTPGYTNSEFPLYPYAVALLYGLFGIHDWLGRLLSALCATAATVVLYRLLLRTSGAWAATVGAMFWALNPVSIFFGRAFLPEPLLVLLIVLTFERLSLWFETGRRRAWATALVAATLATMVKQPALHIVLALALAWRLAPAADRRRVPGWLLPVLPTVACLLWYNVWAKWLGEHYVGHFAVGGGSGLINPGLWLSGAVNFYPRFAVATIVLIGSVTGLPIALLGLGKPQRPFDWVLLAWLAGAVAIVLVANGAAITHYYYLLPTIAAVAVYVGRGAAKFEWSLLRWVITVLAVCGPLLVVPFPEVAHWYDVRASEVAAARAVRSRTESDAYVYTICYGTQLLYEADRRGDFLLPEASFLEPRYVEEAAERGFSYLATGRADLLETEAGAELKRWLAGRPVIASGPGWLVVGLHAGNHSSQP